MILKIFVIIHECIYEDLSDRDQCYLKCDDFANIKDFINWNIGTL